MSPLHIKKDDPTGDVYQSRLVIVSEAQSLYIGNEEGQDHVDQLMFRRLDSEIMSHLYGPIINEVVSQYNLTKDDNYKDALFSIQVRINEQVTKLLR